MNKLSKAEWTDIVDAIHAQLEYAQALYFKKKTGVKPKVDLQAQGGMVFIPQDENRLRKCQPDFKFFDASWCRMKQLEEELLHQHLLPFARRVLSEEVLLLDTTLSFFHDVRYIKALYEVLWGPFVFWLLFDWTEKPFSLSTLLNKPIVVDKPMAIQYLHAYPHRLSQKQKKWIKAMSKTYYSFYVVMAILPQQQLQLKDIFLGTEQVVTDYHACLFLKTGDIIWSRILTFEEQSICMGIGPYVIPARYHLWLFWITVSGGKQNPRVS